MNKINLIQKFIKKIKKNQKILIAYSGGLDSTVLLNQLIPFQKKKPFIQIRAIYINHNTSKKTKTFSQHCKKTCQTYKIQFIQKNIKITTKNNFQNNARKLRYKIFEKNMLPNEILVTGHHANDQCETLFLSLIKGRGIPGLSGIPHLRYLHSNKIIIRPLLKYTKLQLENWAKKNKINWINDESNLSNKYDRNFIRNKIIIKMQNKWPYFINNCIKSMKILYNQEHALNYFLDQEIKKQKTFKNIFNIYFFQNYSNIIQTLLIRRWLFLKTKNTINYINTQNIYTNLVVNKEQNKNNTIAIKKNIITRYKNKIYYIKKKKSIKNKILFWHNHNKSLTLPQNLGYLTKNRLGIKLPKPKKTDLINIRFQLNKTIYINQYYKKRTKTILQENQITPWNRNRIPILFYNNQPIAIIGIVNLAYKKNKKKIIKTWNISWINEIKY
ncbi:tRNA lysidine(34) synthetase TilS [Buchnera aphidicola]|uniref:tRNA lysidine(34) synthetase TilS n=1 Tax=Buchnera aphidicola TaxID=9 RepID=UPI0031B8163D